MKCPHCLEYFDRKPHPEKFGKDNPPDEDHRPASALPPSEELAGYAIVKVNCTACGKLIVQLLKGIAVKDRYEWNLYSAEFFRWILPASPSRMRFFAEIPIDLRSDYDEAVAVFPFSSAASAALSRRCLQSIIRTKAGITRKTLYDEIEDLLKSTQLPAYLQEVLHPVRQLGNLASHPLRSLITSEIVPVGSEEASFCLTAIESLLDFYCVQPKIAAEALEKVRVKVEQAN